MTCFGDMVEMEDCDHEIVMTGDDMINFYYECLYCDYEYIKKKLGVMNC